MFLRKLDNLSPPITLYFKEENQHSSVFSGILTFIVYVIVFIFGVYYALEFINKESPKAYFFNRYIEDAGTFPLNSSSMFNFIQIADTRTNDVIPFDFSVFRVVGFDDVYYEEYMKNPNILEEKDHWVYDFCNNNSDTKGIGYLIDFKYYEQSACMRKYYNKNTKKYYNTDEEGFRWPVLEKGCSNPNRTYYGIIMQRCDTAPEFLKSQGTKCKHEKEITEYLNGVSLVYQLIDHYADMLNYKMPFTKYFYEVTSAITNGMYIINHLNFNPASMLTHNGIFFDNQISELSYFLTQNEKHAVDQSSLPQGQTLNGCLIGIYFWMQNNLQYYERNYDRLQDVLSDIGGISSIAVTIAYFINLLVNYYIILIDTVDFVMSTEENNFIKKMKARKKPTIFKQARGLMAPPKRNNLHFGEKSYSQQPPVPHSSNYQRFMKEAEKKELNLNIYKKRKNIFTDYINTDSDKRDGDSLYNNSYNKSLNKRESNENENSKKFFENSFNQESNLKMSSFEKKETIYKNKSIQKQNFTWIRYIWYLICCGKSDKKISYYETFRSKLISEENIIQSYLDIYGLLKINNIQKKTTLIEKESLI